MNNSICICKFTVSIKEIYIYFLIWISCSCCSILFHYLIYSVPHELLFIFQSVNFHFIIEFISHEVLVEYHQRIKWFQTFQTHMPNWGLPAAFLRTIQPPIPTTRALRGKKIISKLSSAKPLNNVPCLFAYTDSPRPKTYSRFYPCITEGAQGDKFLFTITNRINTNVI